MKDVKFKHTVHLNRFRGERERCRNQRRSQKMKLTQVHEEMMVGKSFVDIKLRS